MSVDISFNPSTGGLFNINSDPFNVPRGTPNLLKMTALEKYSAPLAAVSIGLQGLADTMNTSAQIDNVFANINRKRSNIDQLSISLMDSLNIQARKVRREGGQRMAAASKSGVTMTGSPLLVMAEAHALGMQDYDAIAEKGSYAIDSAYQSIYDDLKKVRSAGKAMIIGGITSAASGAFSMSKYK